MPIRLQKIDEHTRPDHYYLAPDDECYFLWEYAPRQGFAYSEANALIINLKKPVTRKSKPEYFYKQQAIKKAAGLLRSALNEDWLKWATLVPIPPSKTKGHALYDDQVMQVLRSLTHGLDCDVRELVTQTESQESVHLDGCRLPPQRLRTFYALDARQCGGRSPNGIAIFDDIITTGSHFKAMQSLLQEQWPSVSICGLFVARRYFPKDE